MGKKVLVTGANGFIGNHLCPLLEDRGAEVVKAGLEPERDSRVTNFDLLDVDGMTQALSQHRPSHIVHLAGISSPQHGDRAEMYQINTLGAVNLTRAIDQSAIDLEHVLAMSSANIYASDGTESINELCEVAPGNDYGVSKLAMEHVFRLCRDQFPVTMIRLFNCTGTGQSDRFVIPKIVRHFAERSPRLRLGNVKVTREYNDIRSVARILASILDEPAGYEILNVCSGRGHSLADAIAILTELTSHSLEVERDPQLVRKHEIATLVGDPTRLRMRFGPLDFIPFEQTLEWMVSERIS